MAHPLVSQLRFTRSEFLRGLRGLNEDDAQQRVMPMNCISWNVGHLAWQEQRYWLWRAQGQVLLPELNQTFAYGAPASTPTLQSAIDAWQTVTQAADPWLDTLTSEILSQPLVAADLPGNILFGNLLQRVIYHYWYHNGENQAIRQALGHTNLEEFVGDIDDEAPYSNDGAG